MRRSEEEGSLHLLPKDLGLHRGARRDQVPLESLEYVLADFGKLLLDVLSVALDHGDPGPAALRLLRLTDSQDSPRLTAGANDVLVCDREEVALFNGELLVGWRGDGQLHVLNHL